MGTITRTHLTAASPATPWSVGAGVPVRARVAGGLGGQVYLEIKIAGFTETSLIPLSQGINPGAESAPDEEYRIVARMSDDSIQVFEVDLVC